MTKNNQFSQWLNKLKPQKRRISIEAQSAQNKDEQQAVVSIDSDAIVKRSTTSAFEGRSTTEARKTPGTILETSQSLQLPGSGFKPSDAFSMSSMVGACDISSADYHPLTASQLSQARTMDPKKPRILEAFKSRTLSEYKILSVVGRGSYGQVYKALHKPSSRVVAIKKVIFDASAAERESEDMKNANAASHRSRPRPKINAEFCRRILRELKLMRYVRGHDSIAEVFDIIVQLRPEVEAVGSDVASSTPLIESISIVMEYLECDLHSFLRYPGANLTEDHILVMAFQLLDGVQYMHSRCILHRDLTPRNVLLDADCRLKICDFGLSRFQSPSLDPMQEIDWSDYVVTRWYRAPELLCQCIGSYGPAVDMWAIGCILTELYSFRVLFRGKDTVTQLHEIIKVLGSPPKNFEASATHGHCRILMQNTRGTRKVKLAEIAPSAPEEALELIDGLLQYDPTERLTAAAALGCKYFDLIRELLASVREDREAGLLESPLPLSPTTPVKNGARVPPARQQRKIWERRKKSLLDLDDERGCDELLREAVLYDRVTIEELKRDFLFDHYFDPSKREVEMMLVEEAISHWGHRKVLKNAGRAQHTLRSPTKNEEVSTSLPGAVNGTEEAMTSPVELKEPAFLLHPDGEEEDGDMKTTPSRAEKRFRTNVEGASHWKNTDAVEPLTQSLGSVAIAQHKNQKRAAENNAVKVRSFKNGQKK